MHLFLVDHELWFESWFLESYQSWIESKCLDSYHFFVSGLAFFLFDLIQIFWFVSIFIWKLLNHIKYSWFISNFDNFRFSIFTCLNRIIFLPNRITMLFLPKILHISLIHIHGNTHTSIKLLNQLQLYLLSLQTSLSTSFSD